MEARSEKSVGELMEEILAMPEYHLYQELLGLNDSKYIFERNYDELHVLVSFLISDPRGHEMIATGHQESLRQIQLDITRRLHNFVASANF